MNSSPYQFVFPASMPVVGLIDGIIEKADKFRASDIHIDPNADYVRIRFRIDGMLHEVCAVPKNIHGEFIARIKIISGLRIDERIVPQDGRFSVGEKLDIRVTVVASYYGESVVMRLLRRNVSVQNLSDLGFSSEDQDKIIKVLSARQGLVLVTGPTGSGKTTTLYSLLSMVNDISVSAVTIEDPVEYAMTNARQIQVQQKRGINFANGLRSILRQDPDVIMVGEIRDHETAVIAISASLTGHLVLSTLHTNDAASTITRCTEMGVEPYLVSATLKLVISQRLVRKLCLECRKIVDIGVYERAIVEKNGVDVGGVCLPVYVAQGCDKCNGTGYFGRTVVAEVLCIDDDLRRVVLEKGRVVGSAVSEMKTIGFQAMTKYVQGVTSFEEAIKVLRE